MADITMCDGKNCKDKKSCYRYTATPNLYYQSYLLFNDNNKRNKDTCENFWDNKYRGIKNYSNKKAKI